MIPFFFVCDSITINMTGPFFFRVVKTDRHDTPIATYHCEDYTAAIALCLRLLNSEIHKSLPRLQFESAVCQDEAAFSLNNRIQVAPYNRLERVELLTAAAVYERSTNIPSAPPVHASILDTDEYSADELW